ncbi:MAG: HNH endonuclease [Dehalococcoidia bacterium]
MLEDWAVIERWRTYAVLRQRHSDDEAVWSVRDGHLWCEAARRLPVASRRGFEPRHCRMEERLWARILDAARRCSALADATLPVTYSGSDVDQTAEANADLSAARWALSRAHWDYRRAATPPRAALPAALRRQLLGTWNGAGRCCGICGKAVQQAERVAIDHILPLSRGGASDATNLRVAHARCNERRGAWHADADADELAGAVRLRFEPPHPSLCAAFACWYCGVPTRGYLDIPRLPTLRLCSAHRDWSTVRPLLSGYGIAGSVLDQLSYIPAQDP